MLKRATYCSWSYSWFYKTESFAKSVVAMKSQLVYYLPLYLLGWWKDVSNIYMARKQLQQCNGINISLHRAGLCLYDCTDLQIWTYLLRTGWNDWNWVFFRCCRNHCWFPFVCCGVGIVQCWQCQFSVFHITLFMNAPFCNAKLRTTLIIAKRR